MVVLLFSVGMCRCAVDVRWVAEVVPAVPLDEKTPSFESSAGSLIRRGKALPIYNLESVFGIAEPPVMLSRRIILFAHSLTDSAPTAGVIATGVTEATKTEKALLSPCSLDAFQGERCESITLFDVRELLARCGHPLLEGV